MPKICWKLKVSFQEGKSLHAWRIAWARRRVVSLLLLSSPFTIRIIRIPANIKKPIDDHRSNPCTMTSDISSGFTWCSKFLKLLSWLKFAQRTPNHVFWCFKHVSWKDNSLKILCDGRVILDFKGHPKLKAGKRSTSSGFLPALSVNSWDELMRGSMRTSRKAGIVRDISVPETRICLFKIVKQTKLEETMRTLFENERRIPGLLLSRDTEDVRRRWKYLKGAKATVGEKGKH